MAEGKGQIISGKYRLLSVLGEGAMGVVYRSAQLDAEGQVLRKSPSKWSNRLSRVILILSAVFCARCG